MFCDPSRLKYEWITVIKPDICVDIAIFCHVCVAMYSYITGYGFAKKFDPIDSGRIVDKFRKCCVTVIQSLIKFMVKYWMVLFLILPVGIYLGKIEFDTQIFVKSVLGISNAYNNEWWYVKQYIKMLIVLPFVDIIFQVIKKSLSDKKSIIVLIIGGVFIALGVVGSASLRWLCIKIFVHLGSFTFVMIEGYICAKVGIHAKCYMKFSKHKVLPYILVLMVVIGRMIVSPDKLDTSYGWIFAPVLIISISWIFKSWDYRGCALLAIFGRYSMWIGFCIRSFAITIFRNLSCFLKDYF